MSTLIKVQKAISPWKIEVSIIKLSRTLLIWNERYHQRKELAQLSNHLLKDIGISRSEAWQEAHKPFWKS